MRTAKIIVLLSAAVFALTACGGDDATDNATDTGQTQAKEDKDAENKAKPADELKKDVKIVDCKSGQGVGLSATIEVTNSLDEPMEYVGTLNFLDANGKQLTDGLFNTGTLQPGETSTEEIPGANVYEVVQGAICEVAEVKLDEPV